MLEEQHENFVAAVTMGDNASGHQCKEKMSGSEKKVNKPKNTYDISSIKKFLEV